MSIPPVGDAATSALTGTPIANVDRKSSRKRMGSGAAKTHLALGKESSVSIGNGGLMELTALGRRST